MIPQKLKYKEKIPCSICGKEAYQQSSVKIHLSNASKHYQGSNRGWIDHYSFKLCQTHYKSFYAGLSKTINDLK